MRHEGDGVQGTAGAERAGAETREILAGGGRLGLCEIALDGRFLKVNDVLCRIVGRSRTELLSLDVPAVTHPDDLPRSVEALSLVLEKGEPTSLDKRYLRPDGTVVFANSILTRLEDQHGRPRGVLGVTADLTERKQMVDALWESEERYRTLFHSIDEGFCVVEMIFDEHARPVDCDVVETNPAFEQLTGIESPEGKTARALVPGLDSSWFERFGEVAVTGESTRFEGHAPALNRWFDVFAFRVGQPEKRRVALLFDNITDRKHRDSSTAFLDDLHGVFARLSGADEIMCAAGERVAAHLGVSSVTFTEIDEPAGQATVIWHQHDETVPNSLGAHCLTDYIDATHLDELRAGHVVVMSSASTRARYGVLSQIHAPHLGDGRWKFVLSVQSGEAREWRADEVELLRELSAHVWLRLERARAEDALRENDRRKDEFLATLAHELRNPLAPLAHGLEILRITGPGPAAERVHAMMTRQVSHMSRLVDDLLEVSRITRGAIELRKERVDLRRLLRTALETSAVLMNGAGHHLEVSLPGEPLLVEADAVRIAQVFGNLLNNAAKYTNTNANGEIRLTARRENSSVVVSVRDNGVGIAAEMLPHIFEMFVQVDHADDRCQEGLGIGLTLVRSLVQMHGGRIEARSEGLGEGTEFLVYLPLAREHEEETSRSGERETGTLPRSCRVLVVDDNRDAGESLGILLETLGAEVHVVYDGPSALDAIERHRPTVALLDLGMPGMDGFEVARRIRAGPHHSDVTLIAMTGWGQEEDRRRTQRAGFRHHLVKPADIGALRDLLILLE